MKRAEQICRHEPAGGFKRELKKRVKRARRQAERRNPEDAPKALREFVRGYST